MIYKDRMDILSLEQAMHEMASEVKKDILALNEKLNTINSYLDKQSCEILSAQADIKQSKIDIAHIEMQETMVDVFTEDVTSDFVDPKDSYTKWFLCGPTDDTENMEATKEKYKEYHTYTKKSDIKECDIIFLMDGWQVDSECKSNLYMALEWGIECIVLQTGNFAGSPFRTIDKDFLDSLKEKAQKYDAAQVIGDTPVQQIVQTRVELDKMVEESDPCIRSYIKHLQRSIKYLEEDIESLEDNEDE